MNYQELDGEVSIYTEVKDLDRNKLNERVRNNAKEMGFDLNDEHLDVINTLVEYYKENCYQDDCLESHPHMRYLEEAYEDKGGSKYLYMLFDQGDEFEGVLTVIHRLAGLPGLRLNVDKGFGTAF